MAEFPVTKPEFIVPSCVNLSTYIQGMSDYEVRCYYSQLVQQWATEWAQMQTQWSSQQQAFEDFKTYVNNKLQTFQDWFDNLDVQTEINNKIDEMVSDGSFLAIIQATVNSQTQSAADSWLEENMTPGAGAPALDASFTLANAAAQSQAVGNKCVQVNSVHDNTSNTLLAYLKGGVYPVSLVQVTDQPFDLNIYQNYAFLVVIGSYYGITATKNYIMQILLATEGVVNPPARSNIIAMFRYVNNTGDTPIASDWAALNRYIQLAIPSENNIINLNERPFTSEGLFALGATDTLRYILNAPSELSKYPSSVFYMNTVYAGRRSIQTITGYNNNGITSTFCRYGAVGSDGTFFSTSDWTGLHKINAIGPGNVPFNDAIDFGCYGYDYGYTDPNMPPDDGVDIVNGKFTKNALLSVTYGYGSGSKYALQSLYFYNSDRSTTPGKITPYLAYQRIYNPDDDPEVTVFPWVKMASRTSDDLYGKLKGLKFSVIGDSISAYQGLIPSGYLNYYPIGDVTSPDQMWFNILADKSGMSVLKTACWSGSMVHGDGTSTTNASAACSTARINDLASGSETPDIVICLIGINDFGPTPTPVGDWLPEDDLPVDSNSVSTFSDAYCIMVNKIMKTYPKARVFCCTLMNAGRNTKDQIEPGIYPTKNNAGVTLDKYNDVIKNVCWGLGCDYIDLHACGITFQNFTAYTNEAGASEPHDKLHPNAAGQVLVANKILAEINAKY